MPVATITNIADLPEILTPRDVEAFLGVCHVTVWKLLKTPDFPALKVGTHWKIPKHALLTWITQQQHQRHQKMRGF